MGWGAIQPVLGEKRGSSIEQVRMDGEESRWTKSFRDGHRRRGVYGELVSWKEAQSNSDVWACKGWGAFIWGIV